MGNPNNDSYAIINVIRTVGLIQVMMGHRLYVDLAAPVLNFEFFDSVRRNYNIFYFTIIIIT